MFVELMPLLAGRVITITVARLNNDTIRVNIIPKRTGDGDNKALSTPFSITGTPAEIDADLATHLMGYTEMHHRLQTTLADAKTAMDAAAKAAQEEAKRKTGERKKQAAQNNTAREAAHEGSDSGDVKTSAQQVAPPADEKSDPSPRLF